MQEIYFIYIYINLYYYNSIVVCLFVCPDCIKEMEE